jgi:ubiquinone/menaquinone biosynthesis C-methylase UbiE
MSARPHDEHIAREFDRAAPRYDDSRLVQSYQRRVQTLVLDRLQLGPGMHVLDLGCGTGWATLEIAARLEGSGWVIGLDLSPAMIQQAQAKLADFPHENVEFVLGSAGALSYENCFDYVISTNAFHHFADKQAVFARVYDALKCGGSFVIQDFCRDFFLMRLVDLLGKIGERAHVGTTTSRELRALLAAAGFAGVQVEPLKLNWPWGIMIGHGQKPNPDLAPQ